MEKVIVSLVLGILLLSISAFSQENIILTTYYPAPFGVYSQLVTQTLGVGDNDGSKNVNAGDGPSITTNPELNGVIFVSKGISIGMGAVAPDSSMEVSKSVILTFFADDGETETKEEFKVTVNDINQLPTLTYEGETEFNENEEVSIDIVGQDGDVEDALSFNVIGLPDWASHQLVGGTNIQVTGTPSCDDSGVYEFTVYVKDDLMDFYVEDTYQFEVLETCDVPCQDHDGDGICNADDLCPAEAGVVESDGCPIEDTNHAPHIVEVEDQLVVESELLEFDFGVSYEC